MEGCVEHFADFLGVEFGVLEAVGGAGGRGDVEDGVVAEDFGGAHFKFFGVGINDLGAHAADDVLEFEVFDAGTRDDFADFFQEEAFADEGEVVGEVAQNIKEEVGVGDDFEE